jgi:hypothetical protein
VDLESGGASWSGGTATIVDASAAFERRVFERVALWAGAGVSYVKGPSDVAPFRFENGSPVHLAGEAGARVSLGELPVAAVVMWHVFRMNGTSGAGTPGEEGVVHRAMLGVSYGR